MIDLINNLFPIKRHLVSPGIEEALSLIKEQYPIEIKKYRGDACGWPIPKSWFCKVGRIRDINGTVLLDYEENPLHVVSHSLPISDWVSRDELFKHLHTLQGAIPFVYKYYERDWGFCCTDELKDGLQDEYYEVQIEIEEEDTGLAIGEWHINGDDYHTFLLCAHIDHPGQAEDDLSGVAVALKVMNCLSRYKKLHYSYKLLILPETIGSLAYIENNKNEVDKIFGGIFLEMLGHKDYLRLQKSFDGETDIDLLFSCHRNLFDTVVPYGTLIQNDERVWNMHGIPMLSVSRSKQWVFSDPYPEYHTSNDTPNIIINDALVDAFTYLIDSIQKLENNQYVYLKRRALPFLSGAGLHDKYVGMGNLEYLTFQYIIQLFDGKHTVSDIMRKLGIGYKPIRSVICDFLDADLIGLSWESS